MYDMVTSPPFSIVSIALTTTPPLTPAVALEFGIQECRILLSVENTPSDLPMTYALDFTMSMNEES